jgi:glyoxylate carboligase
VGWGGPGWVGMGQGGPFLKSLPPASGVLAFEVKIRAISLSGCYTDFAQLFNVFKMVSHT